MEKTDCKFEALKGKTLTEIRGLQKGKEDVWFHCSDGCVFHMFHRQDCCENVYLEDVCGDVEDLIGSEILVADEIIQEGENPEGFEEEYQESFTWTFYKLATRKGYVDLRWYGESNGYYSERVDFEQTAYESLKVFASIIDEATKNQIKELAESDAYRGCMIRVMPDCHAGTGCTIGSVIEYRNRVVSNTVGVDIGCGMLTVVLGRIDVDLEKLDQVVNEKIPSGFNIHKKPVADFDLKLVAHVKDEEYILRSIGTLGGGNHFIELDTDSEGCKYLVIHSGSRNLGVQVCDYWQERAYKNLTDNSAIQRALIDRLKAEGRQSEIQVELKKLHKPKINKELAYLENGDLIGYLHDMRLCQEYASLNRETMASIICRAMGWERVGDFTTIHNYIDIPSKIIRKGAISAKDGERVLIPMNMRDGSLICRGKGNPDWLESAPHGAGRIMSRAQAIREIKMEDFEKSMQGIYTTSVVEETRDEAPMVYKPADIILKDIEPTVKIISVIKPLYNFKAKSYDSIRGQISS